AAMNPEWLKSLVAFRESLPPEYKPQVGQCLLVAGVISWLLALFCLILPNTPPSREAKSPFAFLGGFKLMANPSFAAMIVVAFLVSTELQFYYVLTPGFFNQSGGPFDQGQVEAALEAPPEKAPAEGSALAAPAPGPGGLTKDEAKVQASHLITDCDKDGDA